MVMVRVRVSPNPNPNQVTLGVAWGMLRQRWDVITATHFAVSALATGGLTAPPVRCSLVFTPMYGVDARGQP